MIDYNSVGNYFESQAAHLKKELSSFLRFKSISLLPECQPEMLACAEWVKGFLADSGFKTELWQTSANPVIFAERIVDPQAPTVLIYNHYDVQPVVKRDTWNSDPFEPHFDGDFFYARGAQDNKGQCFYVLAAMRYLGTLAAGPKVNVKLIIEGDEERLSPQLEDVFIDKQERLKADHSLIVDVGFHNSGKPSVTIGLRGYTGVEITLKGPKIDLHSGVLGGVCYNPIQALTEILSGLKDENGRVAVEGFYDTMEELDPSLENAIDFFFDEDKFKAITGVDATGGEKGIDVGKRATVRPTLEITGISGGHIAEGIMPVIPATANAKMSCRLVQGQDPNDIRDKVVSHLEKHLPPGISMDVTLPQGGCRAMFTDPNSPIVRTCQEAITDVTSLPCNLITLGATVPISAIIEKYTGSHLALIGYALPTDNMHGPNENFSWSRIRQGFETIIRVIDKLDA